MEEKIFIFYAERKGIINFFKSRKCKKLVREFRKFSNSKKNLSDIIDFQFLLFFCRENNTGEQCDDLLLNSGNKLFETYKVNKKAYLNPPNLI